MAAILYRKRSGLGQFIDVSVHEACALTTEMHMSTYIYTGKVARRQTGQHANVTRAPARQLPTATPNRYLIAMANIQTRRQLEPIVKWMEREGKVGDLADEQYQDSAYIAAHSADVAGKVKDFIGQLPVDDAYHGAQAAGQPWGPVRAPEEVYEDQHFHARGFFPEVAHPELGETIPYLGGAAIYPKSPWRIYRRAPLIGEDNASVFAELGVTEQDVAALRETGAV